MGAWVHDMIPNHEYITAETEDFATQREAGYWYCLDCKHPCKSDFGCDCCMDEEAYERE